MPKISFNAYALGIASNDSCSDMRHALVGRPTKTVVVIRSGIEAIREGLRLSDVKGFDAAEGHGPACDVDP